MNTDEDYRDHLSTVAADGSRVWVYPKKPSGWYYNVRTIVSWFLLLVLFGLPFLKMNGEPMFLFNVLESKFIIMGIIFTPQDMHLFAITMITFIIFIVLFTVVFGRLFCGWVCPQTIFMEMVFRKIEYLIEGTHNQQIKLNKAPWTSEKIFKKTLKHIIFFAIAVLIANTFLSYIIGVDQVKDIIIEPISLHLSGFVAMIFFSFVFYSVFAFFREQVCIAVCPYGRLQSVLLVKESIVVIYDWVRGEPRGKIKKAKKDSFEPLPVIGDCIDCNLCVQVCPTGIDIRHGTQLECVNCTACMDACDEVMDKIGRDKGLIRYDSHDNIDKKVSKIFTPRVWAYSALLIILIAAQGFLLGTRTDVEAVILRTPGMLFQKVGENHISNLYNFDLINKTTIELENIEIRLIEPDGKIKLVGQIPDIEPLEIAKGSFFVELHKDSTAGRKTKINIGIYSNDKLIEKMNTNFLGPIK